MTTATTADPQALAVAEALHQREEPQATILFGSRARGDHEDPRSDLDIMLVLPEEPDAQHKQDTLEWAEKIARSAYGRRTPVQLVWFSRQKFEANRRYVNHITTQAMLDGIVMSTHPEDFRSRYSGDTGETEYEYQWADYENRLHHAEAHLEGFNLMAGFDQDDLLIGQQAQSALEHAMKAVIYGNGGVPQRNTHNIGQLLGTMRRLDPELREFSLSIPADIYSEYAGDNEYGEERKQPRLKDQEDYRERTATDVAFLIQKAKREKAKRERAKRARAKRARAKRLGPNRPS